MTKLHMQPHRTNGILITFCGLDGCGKSTMIRMIREVLDRYGFDVLITKQPTDMMRQTNIFRTYMDSEDHSNYEYRSLSLMAAADRIQHSNKEILPELEKGKAVISDRYFYSCLANLRARGFSEDRWIYEMAQFVIKPDLAFFLDVPVEIAVERVRQRPEEKFRYIDMELQYRLRDEYKNICKENNGIWVASDKKIDETFLEIFSYIKKYLGDEIYE